MTARNDITGDLIKSRGNSPEYMAEHERIFGKSRVQRGRYRMDKETKQFIPIHEWLDKYGSEPKPRGPMIHVSHFDAFESPSSGKIIRNKREYLNDLKETGCRPYEGLAREKQEADRYLKQQDEKFESTISQSVEQTAYELEHGYIAPQGDNTCNFDFGE